MDSSSDEDIVKKKGWAVVNEKGSLENSSDEEQLQNVAEPDRTLVLPTCQDNAPEEVKSEEAAHSQSLSPLTFQLPPPESPTLQTPGSNSSSGSTLVSSLPSPQPHLQRDLPINKVEVDLSSVADILKSKVEKEDSQSVDSFEILSESASGDCEPSPDCQSEEGDDESLLPPPSQNIPHRFTSDSESDFVRLKAPSDMDSAHSGLEEITSGPSQSSKEISSSPEPVLPIGPRPVNAPYQEMRGTSSEEDSDHVRIMSRRWPTEDGGFLLVQRFKKLEPDDISTVSSSISDFSSFSMMGSTSRQRLISDTQEEAGESDTESEASYSSYASEEPLPVNMMVQNVPPAVRQYLHKRNEVFNSKLTIFAVLVLTAGLTLGIGHFVGSSQMVSHHESVQEGQKLRLRSLQDELVSCMDRKKEIARLYQEKEKEVHHCAKEKDELVKDISSAREMENSWTIGDNDLQELRLCSGCSDAGLRYSKFCNTRCPADSVEGHSWVAMEIRSSTEQEYAVNGGSDGHGFEPGQVAPIHGMHNVVQGSEHKMPNYASSVIRSFDNFVAPQAPVSALGGEVVLPGESPHLSKGSISDPVHSTTINDESEESSVQSSPQNEESEELANHFASADEENEAFTTHFTLVNENDQKTPASFSPHSEGIQDLPGHSLSLDGEDEETDSAKLVTYSKNLKWEKTESQKDGSGESISVDADIGTSEKESVLHLFLGDDAMEEGDSMAFLLRTLENDIKSHASIMDRTSGDSVSLDVENVKDVQTIVTEDKLQTKKIGDATFDTDAKWVCVDEAEPEHCQDWIPKAEVNMNLEQFEKWEAIHTYKLIYKQKVRDEVHQDTVDTVNEKELQSLDKFEPLSVDDNARELLEMNGGEKLSERAAENSGRNNEEKKGDASMKDEGTVVGEMEETLEGEEAWIWTESEEWVSAGSEGNEDDAILGTINSEEQTDEKLDEQEDHKNGDQQTDQFDVITNALQSAWGIVENASRDIIGTNVSLKGASDIVKERVGELKEVVGDAWDSVQTVASRVNADHIQPMVKKVNKFVKSRWSEKGSGRSCRGKHCKGGRKNGCRRHGNVNSRRARKTDLPQRGGSADRIGKRNKKNMGKNAKKSEYHTPTSYCNK